MNFYELYQIINENTVAQELKKFKKENSSFNTDNILSVIRQKKILFPNINDESFNILANWVLFNYLKFWKQIVKTVRASSPSKNDKPPEPSLGLFQNYLMNEGNLRQHSDYLNSQIDNTGNFYPNLASKFNNPNFTFENLKLLDDEYHEKLKKKQKNKPGRIGKTILTFNDGYSWVDLQMSSCDIESETMGHCGNAGGRPGDTILSLRDKKNTPHLTFILNNGSLGEMKGKNNEKPVAKYHPYIIELLKLPIINKIVGGGYNPENNFKLNDLNDKQKDELFEIKPKIFKVDDLTENMLRLMEKDPEEFLLIVVNSVAFPISLKLTNTIEKSISKISTERLIELMNENTLLKRILASNKNTPLKIIEKLAEETEKEMYAGINRTQIRDELAQNLSTPKEILLKLSKDSQPVKYFAQTTLLIKGDVESDFFDKSEKNTWIEFYFDDDLVRNKDNYTRIIKMLNILSKDKEFEVRAKVANSKYATEEILEKLSEDENPRVRMAVAHNRKTSEEIIEKLSKDEDYSVRVGVAVLSRLSEEIIEKLSRDENPIVRLVIASNLLNNISKTSNKDYKDFKEKILDRLKNDSDEQVRTFSSSSVKDLNLKVKNYLKTKTTFSNKTT